MADKSGLKEKSLLPLYIFEILRKFSSKENPLSEKQIKEKINAAEIFKDSEAIKDEDRKIIPRHIRTLVDHFAGLIVPVETAKNKAAKWYYDSSKAAKFEFLSRNNFTLEEIGLLVDMIDSSKLVTETSTQAVIDKLLASLNEIDENEKKKERENNSRWYKITATKNENEYKHEIMSDLNYAIDDEQEINLTLEYSLVKIQTIKNVCAYSLYPENGKSYVLISDGIHEKAVDVNQIKEIKLLGRARNYDSSLKEKYASQEIAIDKDGKWLDFEISNDTLFTNLKVIAQATKEKRYLNFKDYKCNLADSEEIEKARTAIPLAKIFHNDAYYLIAIEKTEENDRSAFIRIDLMKEVKTGDLLSECDLTKIESKKVESFLKNDPYIKSKTVPISFSFYIKKEAIQRVTDKFGNTAKLIKYTDPFDNTSKNLQSIGRKYPEYFTKNWAGFNYGDKLIQVEAEATEEDALHWALENADVVELQSPEHLRLKLLDLAKDFTTRYSKSSYDSEQEQYRKIMSGEEFLTYGALVVRETNDKDPLLKRIFNESAYDKVKKLKIKNTKSPIPTDELKKYTNIEELVIDGNGVNDFTWIANLPSLRCLTLKNTTIESGDVLSKIPHLDALFLNENRCLQNYDFLIDLDVNALCLGYNGSADISPLYKLRKTERLILKESMLWDIDMEKIQGLDEDSIRTRRHVIVERWIEDTCLTRLPASYYIDDEFFYKRKRH